MILIPQDICPGEFLSSTGSDDSGKIKVYVGTDKKLHFVNKAGADTALNFSSGGVDQSKIQSLMTEGYSTNATTGNTWNFSSRSDYKSLTAKDFLVFLTGVIAAAGVIGRLSSQDTYLPRTSAYKAILNGWSYNSNTGIVTADIGTSASTTSLGTDGVLRDSGGSVVAYAKCICLK